MLQTGENCWRIERANRAALIVDAADYFRLARQAMLEAREQVLIIGWDFDTRISLMRECGDGLPVELGSFISCLPKRRKGLEVYILKWDIGAIKLLGRGTTLFRIARWALGGDVHFKLDGAHAAGASHHQKILVIDDRLAFCGGIDMTVDRWDTREHRDHDPGRKRPTTHRPYGPWHDATMAIDGAVASALGELARDRWEAAGGKPIPVPTASYPAWPKDLAPGFKDVDVAISRTRGALDEQAPIREIQALFLDQIRRAKKLIYAENQYFASRVIVAAIVERLAEPDPPEIIIVNPRTGEGWLDEEVMSPARAELLEMIEMADHRRRFRIFTPVTDEGADIYVHAKILIVDDQLIRVGSANFNNRSMGLDSECDLTIDTALETNRGASEQIADVLFDLLSEHLGTTVNLLRERVQRRGSYILAIEELTGEGRKLIPFEPEEPNKLESTLAKNEFLDPECGDEAFEPLAGPTLPRGMRGLWRAARRRNQ
ncbi:phospholipase D/transphosphatidylase [Novosphingobium endophyticum]|uniref:Phospholipase D n=1 Tax=Novosphingobium endophyticum TaxID=1955250 RepID=A0A916TVZ1_9SPHN|nr:phospholipase D-like domain-containing protein [Novosphingobium endophyticum]GGC13253.1 phospholipase D/transphosphatidylase [Novosphingobium endophyticum]